MQLGIANYLKSQDVYKEIPQFFQQKRDLFRSLLSETRFKLLPCKGSYFQCVSYSEISEEKDTEIAKRLVTDFGVASIPLSAFYTKNIDDKILRFCFAKEQSTLEQAVEKLMKI
jgi:methionine aminotransferase